MYHRFNKKNPRQFVYFISYEDGPIKIGKASNIKSRLKGLQTSTHQKLDVLGVMKGHSTLEHALHNRFASLKLSGEWFKRDESVLRFIDEHTVSFEEHMSSKKYIDQSDEIKSLKLQLDSVKKDISEEFTDCIANNVNRELKNLVSDCMFKWVLAARKLVEFEEVYREEFSKNGLSLLNTDQFILKARRIVDSAIDDHWTVANKFLQTEHFDPSSLDEMASVWITKISNYSIRSVNNKYVDRGD